MVFFTDRDLGKHQFPDVLKAAGINVQRHADHFADAAPDAVWITEGARRGWIGLTHDARIRYTPTEKAAVLHSGLRLFVLVGKAPVAELAQNFVNTRHLVEAYAARPAPFIARVYRPSPKDLVAAGVPGRVESWWP